MLMDMHLDQLVLSAVFICSVTFIAAWFTDKIVGYAGFTVLGNWLMITLGAYVSMYCFNKYGYRLQADPVLTILVVSAGAATMLMFMIGVKRIARFA